MSTGTASVKWRKQDLTTVQVTLPVSAASLLEALARYRDMSSEALLREYIGAGLREDQRRYFEEQALSITEEVLAKQLRSPGQAAELMREIRREINGPPSRPRFRKKPGDADPGGES